MLGYEKVGFGRLGVIVLNDWMCDTSTWDGARIYLDGDPFTWVFADLRGYGKSINKRGQFTLIEAAGDVLEVADALHFKKFVIVGHSMSSLVALHLAQQNPDRIRAAIALSPPPPAGFEVDGATLTAMQAAVSGDVASRVRMLKRNWGHRLSDHWIRFKESRWRACSNIDAVIEYTVMFAREGLPDRTTRIMVPVLAITGEEDAPPMRSESVMKVWSPLCEKLMVSPIANCGHYPMQETPPLATTHIERFLATLL